MEMVVVPKVPTAEMLAELYPYADCSDAIDEMKREFWREMLVVAQLAITKDARRFRWMVEHRVEAEFILKDADIQDVGAAIDAEIGDKRST